MSRISRVLGKLSRAVFIILRLRALERASLAFLEGLRVLFRGLEHRDIC